MQEKYLINKQVEMYNGFEDKVAIVTGAGSGLGRAIAEKLASLHVKLALLDKDETGLLSLISQLQGNHRHYLVDITKEDQVKKAVDDVVQFFGKIDILVNSAGITGQTAIKSHEVLMADMQKVFDVNFNGSFYTSKYVLPWMVRNNYGRVLHVASIAGKEGNAGMLAYSASKAAVIAMTKVQGKEYAETPITINAVAPAVIRTALVDKMPAEQVKYMTDKIPVKRCGTLQEAAAMAVFIVSDENSFCTGFTFDLSGGRATY